jgi:hypothetical protein
MSFPHDGKIEMAAHLGDVEIGWLLQERPSAVSSKGTAMSVKLRRGSLMGMSYIPILDSLTSCHGELMFLTGPTMCKTNFME